MISRFHSFASSVIHRITEKFRIGLLFGCITLMFSSCLKDDFDFDRIKQVEWNPEVALPLVNTSLTFQDILNRNPDINVEVGSDQFCTLIYNDTLYRLMASDILQMKDQDVKYEFSMDTGQASLFNGQGSFSYSFVQHISFKADDQAVLDSILFKAGRLNLDLTSSFRQQASIQISMPGLKKNGQSFSRKFDLDFQGTVPVSTSLSLDLKDYLLDITNNGTAANDLTVAYKIEIKGSGNPVSGTDKLTVEGLFKNMKFKSLFGYLGQRDLSQASDSISVNFLNSQPGTGSFTLVNPRMKVSLINSIGIPVYASIPSLTAYSQSTGSYPINSGIPNPLPVYSPLVTQAGQQLTGQFELNSSNSNLASVISHLPEYLIYQIGMQTNPEGKLSQNFITDSSSLVIAAGIELPLYGSAKDFIISDTTEFKMENWDLVESMELKTTLTNGFPVDLHVQVYFTDENFNILDSLIHSDTHLLKSASVDQITGRTTTPGEMTSLVDVNPAQVERIRKAKNIVTMGSAVTVNGGNTNVRIYADYNLGIYVGAKARLKVLN